MPKTVLAERHSTPRNVVVLLRTNTETLNDAALFHKNKFRTQDQTKNKTRLPNYLPSQTIKYVQKSSRQEITPQFIASIQIPANRPLKSARQILLTHRQNPRNIICTRRRTINAPPPNLPNPKLHWGFRSRSN